MLLKHGFMSAPPTIPKPAGPKVGDSPQTSVNSQDRLSLRERARSTGDTRPLADTTAGNPGFIVGGPKGGDVNLLFDICRMKASSPCSNSATEHYQVKQEVGIGGRFPGRGHQSYMRANDKAVRTGYLGAALILLP